MMICLFLNKKDIGDVKFEKKTKKKLCHVSKQVK